MEVSTEELNHLIELRVSEVLNKKAKTNQATPWSKFSNQIDLELADHDPREAYTIKSAFCTIIRCALGAKRVVKLNETEIEQARDIVHILLALVNDWNKEASR